MPAHSKTPTFVPETRFNTWAQKALLALPSHHDVSDNTRVRQSLGGEIGPDVPTRIVKMPSSDSLNLVKPFMGDLTVHTLPLGAHLRLIVFPDLSALATHCVRETSNATWEHWVSIPILRLTDDVKKVLKSHTAKRETTRLTEVLRLFHTAEPAFFQSRHAGMTDHILEHNDEGLAFLDAFCKAWKEMALCDTLLRELSPTPSETPFHILSQGHAPMGQKTALRFFEKPKNTTVFPKDHKVRERLNNRLLLLQTRLEQAFQSVGAEVSGCLLMRRLGKHDDIESFDPCVPLCPQTYTKARHKDIDRLSTHLKTRVRQAVRNAFQTQKPS